MAYRPSSARRPYSSVNPITGEKITYEKQHPSGYELKTTPMIPTLDLSEVGDSDRRAPVGGKPPLQNSTRPPSANAQPSARLGSYRPESRAYGNFNHQQAIYTNRHGNLIQNTRQDMDPNRVPAPAVPRPYSSRGDRAVSTRLPDSVRQGVAIEGLASLTQRDSYLPSIESPVDEFQLGWLISGNHQESLEKVAAVEKHEQRKQEMLTEQVLVDQLSRYVLSDIEQEIDRNRPIPMQQQPRRNLDRRMHETRVKTNNSLTENLLSKRIRFTCRLLTRDGKDALRELFGFYFMLDQTLAIYEYRILGKRSSALPLLPRNRYFHLAGYNQGQPYNLLDIYKEARLDFDTRLITSLPETVRQRTKMTLCIISIDEQEKQTLLLEGVQDLKRREVLYAIKHPYSPEQLEYQRYMADIHQLTKPQIAQRSSIVYTSLARFFRKRARLDRSEEINTVCICEKEDFLAGLHEFNIHLSSGHFAYIWSHMSIQGEANEFLNLVFGELNERRFAQVIKAYSKLDSTKSGFITLDTMKKFVNLRGHPYAIEHRLTDEKLWSRFCDTFRFALRYPQISYSEFLNLYEGLNLSIDQDDDFVHLVNNTWNI